MSACRQSLTTPPLNTPAQLFPSPPPSVDVLSRLNWPPRPSMRPPFSKSSCQRFSITLRVTLLLCRQHPQPYSRSPMLTRARLHHTTTVLTTCVEAPPVADPFAYKPAPTPRAGPPRPHLVGTGHHGPPRRRRLAVPHVTVQLPTPPVVGTPLSGMRLGLPVPFACTHIPRRRSEGGKKKGGNIHGAARTGERPTAHLAHHTHRTCLCRILRPPFCSHVPASGIHQRSPRRPPGAAVTP